MSVNMSTPSAVERVYRAEALAGQRFLAAAARRVCDAVSRDRQRWRTDSRDRCPRPEGTRGGAASRRRHRLRLGIPTRQPAVRTAQAACARAVRPDGLMRTQRFLDRHLNLRHDTQRRWPDFPPASIAALLHIDFPREWSHMEPHDTL